MQRNTTPPHSLAWLLAAIMLATGCLAEAPDDSGQPTVEADRVDDRNRGDHMDATPEPYVSDVLLHPGHGAENGTLGTSADATYGVRLFEDDLLGGGSKWWLWQWHGASAKAGFQWHTGPSKVPLNNAGALWFTSFASPGNYDVGVREVSWAITPAFTLKGKGNLLRFRTTEQTDGTNNDRRMVYIWRSGIGWTRIATSAQQHAAPVTRTGKYAANYVAISLDDYATDTSTAVRVAFAFDTVNAVDNKHLGWVIDDVSISRHDVPITEWQAIDNLSGAPAIGTLDGRVHVAAVRETDGKLVTTYTDTGGDFAPIETLLTGATFNTDIEPQMVQVGDDLVLIAAPTAGMPRAWRRKATDPNWTELGAVSTGATAGGRISVTVTGPKELHIAFRLKDSSVTRLMRLRIEPSYVAVEKTNDLFHPADVVPDVTIASDGANQLLLLMPAWYNGRHTVYTGDRSSNFNLTYRATSQFQAGTSADAVYHQGRFFFYYGDMGGRLRGEQLLPSGSIYGEAIATDVKTTLQPRVAMLHHAIVIVYRAEDGQLRFVRREKMAGKLGDASLAWHPYQTGGGIGEGARPLNLDAVPSVAPMGDELFIAASSLSMTDGGSAWGSSFEPTTQWLMMSRAIFKKRLEEVGLPIVGFNEMNDYDQSRGYPDVQMEPWRLAITTRFGRATWDLPAWMVDDFFIAYTAKKEGQPAAGTVSGEAGATRILLSSVNHTANYAPDGVRLDVWDTTYTTWEELAHWVYDASVQFGFGGVPLWSQAQLNQIATLTAAPTPLTACVDGTATGACAGGRRLGYYDRYESPSAGSSPTLAHAWIYMVVPYARHGATYRTRAAADTTNGVPLLQQKYDWAKAAVFGGTEFDDDWKPLAP